MLFLAVAVQDLPGFHLVEHKDVDILQRQRQDLLIHGRRVQDNDHALFVGLFHDVRQLVDLVLQNQIVSHREMGKDAVHLLFGDQLVCSAVEQDTVVALLIPLDNGVTGTVIGKNGHILGVDTSLLHGFQQEFAVRADGTGVVNLRACFCQGDGLVQSLAAGKNLQPRRG